MDDVLRLIVERLNMANSNLRDVIRLLGNIQVFLYPELSESEVQALHYAKLILRLLEGKINDDKTAANDQRRPAEVSEPGV